MSPGVKHFLCHPFRAKRRWRVLALVLFGSLAIFTIFAVLFAIPFLAIAMMIGSRLLMILLGPVNVWNMTWRTPPAAELAGYYRADPQSVGRLPPGSIISGNSGFRLTADHRIDVTDVPAFGDFGKQANCAYSGTGTWSTFEDTGVSLNLNIKVSTPAPLGSPPPCPPAALLGLFEVLGHSPPIDSGITSAIRTRAWVWLTFVKRASAVSTPVGCQRRSQLFTRHLLLRPKHLRFPTLTERPLVGYPRIGKSWRLSTRSTRIV